MIVLPVATCKAAMNNFTRTMAVELSDHGIRVNCIAPDFTETPGLRGNDRNGPVDPSTWYPVSEAQKDGMARRIPLQRGGVDSECGQAALYLCSPMASYVTGVILPVDGGTWASGGWVGYGFDGVHVFTPEGERIGHIRLPETTSNLVFGGPKRNRLMITASQSIYAVYVNTKGAHIT